MALQDLTPYLGPLSVRLDLQCGTVEAKEELDQFLKANQNEMDIVWQLENEFLH